MELAYMMENSKYITSAEIKQQGRAAYYKMLEKVRQGELIQVRRGVYAHAEQMSAGMIDIDSVVPDGILCLWSAWSIHRLTTSMPQAFHIAVKRGRKVPVLAIPQVEIHYYSDALLNIGVTETTVDGFSIRLYDVERCVCDAVKFRNKVGMDVCTEIINNYLERPDRNLSRLMDYARLLRVGNIIEKYLQVKL
jgi:predicted transcriptional regulator of viral defense system